MSLDELYSEKRRLDNAIPSFSSTKTILLTIFFQCLIIVGCLYAMKDGFSLIITGLLVWSVYFLISRFVDQRNVNSEIKSRF